MTKRTYQTCEASVQDEFPGWADGDGSPITGTITQLELHNPHDSSQVVAWFADPKLAERVARLLNRPNVTKRRK